MLEFSHISAERAHARLQKISGRLPCTSSSASLSFDLTRAQMNWHVRIPIMLDVAAVSSPSERGDGDIAANHPMDGRILAPAMSRPPNAPAAAVIRQVVQTGSVNFMTSAQLPLAQTLSELTSATR